MPGIMAGWGGPGSGLNRVLPSPPACGLERGSFPCPRSQGPWCRLSQWGRELGSAPPPAYGPASHCLASGTVLGPHPPPLAQEHFPGGPRQGGWESQPVLLQVGNQVKAEWQAGLKHVPDSGSTGHSPCLLRPRVSTPPPPPPIPLLPPKLHLSWLVLAHLLFSANFCAHSPPLTEKKSTAQTWRLMFYSLDGSEDLSPRHSISNNSEGLL